MFTPDDLVVYPAQGVGKIERIDRLNIGGIACEFYIVRIRANNITLMVPVNNAVNVGLRTLTPKDEAQRILQTLRGDTDTPVYTGQNWNRRFREYSERLKARNSPWLRKFCANCCSSGAARNSLSVNAACRSRPWAWSPANWRKCWNCRKIPCAESCSNVTLRRRRSKP